MRFEVPRPVRGRWFALLAPLGIGLGLASNVEGCAASSAVIVDDASADGSGNTSYGTGCSSDRDCNGLSCLASVCSSRCSVDADCPSGFQCVASRIGEFESRVCVARPSSGDAALDAPVDAAPSADGALDGTTDTRDAQADVRDGSANQTGQFDDAGDAADARDSANQTGQGDDAGDASVPSDASDASDASDSSDASDASDASDSTDASDAATDADAGPTVVNACGRMDVNAIRLDSDPQEVSSSWHLDMTASPSGFALSWMAPTSPGLRQYFQIVDAQGATVLSKREVRSSDFTGSSPTVVWNGSSFDLFGYLIRSGGVASNHARNSTAQGTLGTDVSMQGGTDSVSFIWTGSKYLGASHTLYGWDGTTLQYLTGGGALVGGPWGGRRTSLVRNGTGTSALYSTDRTGVNSTLRYDLYFTSFDDSGIPNRDVTLTNDQSVETWNDNPTLVRTTNHPSSGTSPGYGAMWTRKARNSGGVSTVRLRTLSDAAGTLGEVVLDDAAGFAGYTTALWIPSVRKFVTAWDCVRGGQSGVCVRWSSGTSSGVVDPIDFVRTCRQSEPVLATDGTNVVIAWLDHAEGLYFRNLPIPAAYPN